MIMWGMWARDCFGKGHRACVPLGSRPPPLPKMRPKTPAVTRTSSRKPTSPPQEAQIVEPRGQTVRILRCCFAWGVPFSFSLLTLFPPSWAGPGEVCVCGCRQDFDARCRAAASFALYLSSSLSLSWFLCPSRSFPPFRWLACAGVCVCVCVCVCVKPS